MIKTMPEEQVRRQLNADLGPKFTDYGADEISDVAAIEGPATPDRTDPAYRHPEFGRRTQS